jgi:hypothetical protein
MKTFLIEDFFHLPPVSTTPVVHLELPLYPRIKKNSKQPSEAWGTDSWKKFEVKNFVALSL